jgi:DNA/RNA endonuclease YhcR with UshA esterase domain
MNKLLKMKWLYLSLLVLAVSFTACVDQEFDEPPLNGEDPDITANATLDDVKAFLSLGEIKPITDDLIIQVTVTADDESGNFYRTVVLEDETGGISLLINNTELYNLFPEGRRLFIKCKGLHIGDYAGLPQLGGNPYDDDGDQRIGGIAEAVLDDVIFPGVWGLNVVPKTKRISELGSNDLNTLILLENVEFAPSSVNATYADAVNQFSVNHTIQDCNGSTILLRSSGFSNFANDATPGGNGSLTAVYTIFANDKQLMIRNTSDVKFEGERCGGGAECDVVNLKCLRDAFNSGASEGPEGTVTGIVITDYTTESVTSRNLYLQDDSGGIVVRFSDDHSFVLGEELTINVFGMELSEFNGLLQINDVPLNQATSNGAGTLPTPRVTTVAEVIANSEAWESTLIELQNVSFSGNSVFDGDVNVSDGTGTLVLFTRGAATFSGESVPSSASKMTAIVSQFNDPQLLIRSPQIDIDGGGSGGDLMSLQSIRDVFAGGASTAPMGSVGGVVISDYTTGNVTGKNLFLQDNSAGIVIRFADDHSFPLGEELEIDVTGMELSEFNGLLQINGVSLGQVISKGQTALPAPRVATISEIITNLNVWESTLLRIENVNFSGNSVYSGAVTVDDGTGTITMQTRSSASFSNDAPPASAAYMMAILSEFNNPEVIIRSPEMDIEGVGGGGGDAEFSEDYQGFSDNDDVMGNGWSNIAVVGTRLWRVQEFSGNLYAQATAFNDTNPDMEAWMITPGLNADDVSKMSFESAMAFYDHDGLTVWISNNFSGDVLNATWQALSPTLAGSSDPDHAWITSGDVDLTGYTGTIHIGFRYVGDSANNNTSYRIDNLVIE